MRRHPFVAIEGLDGSGKTTLRKGLSRLWQGLADTVPLCIPGTNHLDPAASDTLLRGPGSVDPDAYLDALAADKQATERELVQPSLDQRPVITDRWLVSDLALLEVRHGLPPARAYEAFAGRLSRAPDLTLVLELPPGTAVERSSARRGDAVRAGWDRLDVQQQVARSYTGVVGDAARYPLIGPVARLDATAEPWTVLHAAWQALRDAGWFPRA